MRDAFCLEGSALLRETFNGYFAKRTVSWLLIFLPGHRFIKCALFDSFCNFGLLTIKCFLPLGCSSSDQSEPEDEYGNHSSVLQERSFRRLTIKIVKSKNMANGFDVD